MARYRNAALFVALAAIWGTAFVAVKAGLADLPPVLFAAIRYDVAGVLMLAYAGYAADHWRPRTHGEWWLVGVGAVLLIGVYNACLFIGQQWTTSAAAAVIISLSPVLTTAFARGLLPAERLTGVGLLGLGLGLAGVVVLAQPDLAAPGRENALGELLVFAAAIAFALGSVLIRRSAASLPIQTLEGWSMVGGAVGLHLVSAAIGESPAAIRWTPEAIVAVGYLAVLSSAVGYLIYFDLLARLGPIEINLVTYVAPAFAALVGWLVLGESVDAALAIGFVLIVAGFGLIKRRAIAEELPRVRAALR